MLGAPKENALSAMIRKTVNGQLSSSYTHMNFILISQVGPIPTLATCQVQF